MAPPALAAKHQLDPGSLPLKHLPTQVKHQGFDLGKRQRGRGGRSEDSVVFFGIECSSENAIKLR